MIVKATKDSEAGVMPSEKLMSDDKVYEGTIKFGETTDSYDADGELLGSLPLEDRRRLEAMRYEDFDKPGACDP